MVTVHEALKAAKGRLLRGSKSVRIKGVSIDSRTIRKAELFIAIKGAKYDGHAFVSDALKKGAIGAVVRSKEISSDVIRLADRLNSFIISVGDTLKALGDIAHFHRNRFDIPVVAVTGSNGKTTTKEMIGRVLQKRWAPLKNFGTQNNLIGVPLTLFKLTGRNKSAVLELGMSRIGEIRRLAEICSPNIGLITNIGPSHLEYLKSLQGIYRAKRELLDFLGNGDIALLNNDDISLRRFRKSSIKIVTFGIERKSDFRAKGIKKERRGWRFNVNGKPYYINSAAYHDIYNALAAVSIGTLFNLGHKEISAALKNYTALEKRMARSVYNGIEFIDDTYNSNPLSLENAIETLAGCQAEGKKILISGDMLELGGEAVYYHDRIGRIAARSGIDGFISVGDLMRNAFLSAKRTGMKNSWFCPSKEEAARLLKEIARPNDVVLVKGSRATQMEDVIKCFTTSFTR